MRDSPIASKQTKLDDDFEAGKITQGEYIAATRALQPVPRSEFELREEVRIRVWGN